MRAVPIHDVGEEVRVRVSHRGARGAATGDAPPMRLSGAALESARAHRALWCRAALPSRVPVAGGARSPRQ